MLRDYYKELSNVSLVDRIETDGYVIAINAWINSHGFQDARMILNEKLMNDLKPLFKKTDINVSNIKADSNNSLTSNPL